ncbi:NAD(P)-binding protein [Mycena sanguinolenta]|nr:NAD(P)-binding protein [Mycena sanguinolenta]
MTITASESAPLVAVVGATGVQGGSVIRALLESDKPYRIRGFTRDLTKAAAETLKKCGVEMVAINLVLENKPEVFKVFTGADYAFLCTNFWEHMDMEKEVSEGKMLVDATKAAGVKGAIWSGLPPVQRISGGKYSRVAHFDRKARVAEYGRASGIPFVEVQAGFYATNLLGNFPLLAKEPDGTYVLAWPVRPSTIMPVIDMDHDFGLYARRVLELPVFPDGSVVCTTGENITVAEMARQLSQVTGKQIVFKQVTVEEAENKFVDFGFPSAAAADIVQGMLFFDEFGYYGGRATASTEGLARPTRTFTEFAEDTDWSEILS